MKITVAVAMWQDSSTTTGWASYAEGWEGSRDDVKRSCEHTIFDNGLNEGKPLYWRFVEAEVPEPVIDEPTVQGEVVE
jgi:hypothetical protein